MKISIGDLEKSFTALSEIKTLKPKSTIAMDLALLINDVLKYLEVFYTERDELIERLGEVRDPKYGKGFWVPEDSKNYPEFTKEYESLLDKEVELQISVKIKVPILNAKDEDITPSVGTLAALYWLFEK